MTTLIAIYDSAGHVLSRCDARCYKAKTEKCVCVCGGINHAAGLAAAYKNFDGFLEKIEEWMQAHPEAHVTHIVAQAPLIAEG